MGEVKALHLLSIVLLALCTSLDSLGVGIVYGMRKIRLPFASNLLIAVLTGLGTLMAMKAGEYVFALMPRVWANYISSGIMIAAGIWIMLQSWARPSENIGKKTCEPEIKASHSAGGAPEAVITLRIKSLGILIRILKEPAAVDRDCSGAIDFKEAIVLGMALSLNNLSGGLGGGMAGLNPELTALLTAITSFFFFVVGSRIGYNCFSRWIGERATRIAGLVLIAIGVYELFI